MFFIQNNISIIMYYYIIIIILLCDLRSTVHFFHECECLWVTSSFHSRPVNHVIISLALPYIKKEKTFSTHEIWKQIDLIMKIFCMFYAAHCIFLTIRMFMTWQAGIDQSIIKHTKSACLPIIESTSILDHNRKLLQALHDYFGSALPCGVEFEKRLKKT